MGWDCPKEMGVHLENVTGTAMTGKRLIFMHKPGNNNPHICNHECKSYPLQTCSSVCGVIASVCAVICALDSEKFDQLIGGRAEQANFLKQPSKYSKFLRRVLICWFMTGSLDLDFLFRHNPANEHSYVQKRYITHIKKRTTNSNVTDITQDQKNTTTHIAQDSTITLTPQNKSTLCEKSTTLNNNATSSAPSNSENNKVICKFCSEKIHKRSFKGGSGFSDRVIPQMDDFGIFSALCNT